MNNMPEVKVGIVAVSRDCFPESLSVNRRKALVEDVYKRQLMYRYLCRMVQKEKDMVLLTCLDSRVPMYEKMGFQDKGAANSTWGGEEWHEMNYPVGIGKLP